MNLYADLELIHWLPSLKRVSTTVFYGKLTFCMYINYTAIWTLVLQYREKLCRYKRTQNTCKPFCNGFKEPCSFFQAASKLILNFSFIEHAHNFKFCDMCQCTTVAFCQPLPWLIRLVNRWLPPIWDIIQWGVNALHMHTLRTTISVTLSWINYYPPYESFYKERTGLNHSLNASHIHSPWVRLSLRQYTVVGRVHSVRMQSAVWVQVSPRTVKEHSRSLIWHRSQTGIYMY